MIGRLVLLMAIGLGPAVPPAQGQQTPVARPAAAHDNPVAACNALSRDRKTYAAAYEACLKAGEDPRIARQAAWQNTMGVLYQVVRNDPAEAAYWYRQAAEQGSAVAQSNLAALLLAGRGVARDAEQAMQWLRRAQAQGYAERRFQTLMGMMLAAGVGAPRDPTGARLWLDRAARQCVDALAAAPGSECSATCVTAIRYSAMDWELGFGGPPDERKAQALYRARCRGVNQVASELAWPQLNQAWKVRDSAYWQAEGRFMRSGVLLEPDAEFWRQAGVMSAPVRREYWPRLPSSATLRRELDLAVMVFRNAGWTDARVDAQVQGAADLLAQCGIRLRRALITSGDGSDDYLDYRAELFQPQRRLRAGIPESPHLRVWFGRMGAMSGSVQGLAELRHPGPVLLAVDDDGLTLAHELGHVLGNLPHPLDFEPSVMQYSALASERFTQEQCRAMRAWPYLFPAGRAQSAADLRLPGWPREQAALWLRMKRLEKAGQTAEAVRLRQELRARQQADGPAGELWALRRQLLLESGDLLAPDRYQALADWHARQGPAQARTALFYRLLSLSAGVGRPVLREGRLTFPPAGQEVVFAGGSRFDELAREHGLAPEEVRRVHRRLRGWRIEDGWIDDDAQLMRLPEVPDEEMGGSQ